MRTIFIVVFVCCWASLNAQQHMNYPDSTKINAKDKLTFTDEFEEFRKQVIDDFEDYRKSVNKEFVEFVKNPWKTFEINTPIQRANEEDFTPPLYIPKEEIDRPIETKPIIVDGVIKPIDLVPQPLPVVPIADVPFFDETCNSFSFFGTIGIVRYTKRMVLTNLSETQIANALETLMASENDNLILDCLKIRDEHKLCDWAYILMLKNMSESIYGVGTKESVLLMAYIYMQSGYKMRLARDSERLYMLFSCKHLINGKSYIQIEDEKYYCLEELPHRLQACLASFPNEQSLSLIITQPNEFDFAPSEGRFLKSSEYPQLGLKIVTNMNLMSFYNTYPVSIYDNDVMTKWAILANTPLQQNVLSVFKKHMGKMLSQMNEYNAVAHLLNWVQTGFEYKSDDEVWGCDRSFFPEETLFYPYNDCEDRAILFTRLVRDLLGLKCLLIYYPGHLATAVHFENPVSGDYVELDDVPYVICDPTYIGAPVGKEMPNMNNQAAKVILLR